MSCFFPSFLFFLLFPESPVIFFFIFPWRCKLSGNVSHSVNFAVDHWEMLDPTLTCSLFWGDLYKLLRASLSSYVRHRWHCVLHGVVEVPLALWRHYLWILSTICPQMVKFPNKPSLVLMRSSYSIIWSYIEIHELPKSCSFMLAQSSW